MIAQYLTIVLVLCRWRHTESTLLPHQESSTLSLQRDGLNWTANVHFCPTSTHQGVFMDILFEEAPQSIITTFGTVASVNKTYYLIVNSITTVRSGSSFDIPFKVVYKNRTDANPVKMIKVDNQLVSLAKASNSIEEITLPFVKQLNSDRLFIEYGMDSKFNKLIKSESNLTSTENSFGLTKLMIKTYLPYSKRIETSTEIFTYNVESIKNNMTTSHIDDMNQNVTATKSEWLNFQLNNLTDRYSSKFHLQNQTDLIIENISQRLIDRVLNILRTSISHIPNACEKESIAYNLLNVNHKLKNDTDPLGTENYTNGGDPKTVKNKNIPVRNSSEIGFNEIFDANNSFNDTKLNISSETHRKYLNISEDINSNGTSKNELNKIDDIFSVNILNYNTSINNAHRREASHNNTDINYSESIESSNEMYPDIISSSDNSGKLLNSNSSNAMSNYSSHENILQEDIILQKLDEKIKEKFAEAEMDPKEIKKIEKEIDKYYSIQVLQEALTDNKIINNSSGSPEYSKEEYDPNSIQKPSGDIKDTEEGCDY